MSLLRSCSCGIVDSQRTEHENKLESCKYHEDHKGKKQSSGNCNMEEKLGRTQESSKGVGAGGGGGGEGRRGNAPPPPPPPTSIVLGAEPPNFSSIMNIYTRDQPNCARTGSISYCAWANLPPHFIYCCYPSVQ